ncbi:unnamed protein product [Arctia plantaginis]|uniref:Uncharacterized protein n=1 Tax=Arctia plantaginis TaxID=874455 RepID=A0A8S1AJV7_ARCPL|nr:unnamed protein product [Arctia plantaginis]
MFFSRPIFFVLGLVLLNSVHTRSNKVCDFKDVRCLTNGANNNLKKMILGIKGVVESSDPLHLPECEGEMKTEKVLKYKIKNGTLSGMKSCRYTYHKMFAEDSTYRTEFLCDQLVLSHYFEAKGYIGPVEIDGQGYLDLTLNNYVLKFNGEFGQFISEKDQKPHWTIKTCHYGFEPRGKVEVDIKSAVHSDKAKSDLAKAYLQQHPNLLEEAARYPVLENYMKIFIKNLDTQLRATPADENVNAEHHRDNALGFLSRILGKRFQNPIIAIIDTGSTFKTPLRTVDLQNKNVDEKKALLYLKDIIQSTGDENNPNVKRTNEKFGNALRTRCEKYIECKIKCKKKKDPCENICQNKYDDLNVCETTKDKWLTKTNRQVYNYLKKNPPQYNKNKFTSTKGPKWADSDECKSSDECESSDECKTSDECKIEIPINCESSDSCN